MGEKDIWRTAVDMLKHFGEDAGMRAGWRAEELFDKGDWAGERAWLLIIAAIQELSEVSDAGPVH